jgi:hypothetical protein
MTPAPDRTEPKGDFDRLVQEVGAPPFHERCRLASRLCERMLR